MAIDGIKTTEICSNQSVASTTSADAKKPANSIMEVANQGNTSVEEKKNTSKLDELLEKMCAEFSKYGLKASEIKNSGILYRISGMNEKQFENADESKIKQVLDCLKTAIKDSIVDGKIDIEKAGKLGNNYFIAVNTGWTIEGFKKHNNSVKKSSLLERLKDTGCLDKNTTIENVKQDVLQKALFDFFNKTLLGPLKNAKTNAEKAKIYKSQLQTFGRLLINTPDSEKAIFKQAISVLASDNRLKGLNAVLASFETPEAKEAWADSWSVEELSQVIGTKDVEGNVPADKDQTAMVAGVFAEKSEESIKETYSQMSEPAKQFFQENADKLKAIKEKEAKGIDLTEEEKELVAQRDLYKNLYSGVISGTAINTKVAQENKKEILGTMNKDAYKLPIYRDVVKQVNEFVEEHPEALTIPKEELVKLLDEVTNGNYSAIAQNPSAELKAPREEKAGTTEIVNTKSKEEFEAAQARLAAKTNEIYNNSVVQQPQFTVEPVVENAAQATEKAGNTKLTTSEIYTLKNQALQSAANITEYLKQTGESKFGFATEAFKKFGEIGTTTQNWAMNYFSNASSCVQQLFLGKIANSYTGMLAAAKEVDLSKFNIIGMGIVTEKAVEKVQEQRGLV